MAWKAYNLIPIDFGWEWLPKVQDVAANLARATAETVVRRDIGDVVPSHSQFMKDLAQIA